MKKNNLLDIIFFNIFGFLIYFTGIIIRIIAYLLKFFNSFNKKR